MRIPTILSTKQYKKEEKPRPENIPGCKFHKSTTPSPVLILNPSSKETLQVYLFPFPYPKYPGLHQHQHQHPNPDTEL
ncbi:hypothetical protein PNOK_0863900 [Pyrrhoderma noxium]|uniref:Uncharacterized protein n=1 Tax=Pyrrhoderma noxium TaxID=2282107 RepID=A0A286U883_9AGAM|nr:hypothetical protein PNOK_0863900 [Pyrrhoderma noxium]